MPETTNVIATAQGNVVIRILIPIGSGEGGGVFCRVGIIAFH
jgi:hypothetical protein